MVLLRRSSRSVGSPLPYHFAVPVQFAEGLVLIDEGQALEHRGIVFAQHRKFDDYVTALTAGERWVEDAARKARIIPAMNFVAVHIDEMGDVVSAAEDNQSAEGFARIVARHSGWKDARFRPGRRL